jgi:UDP-glucose 4-epimerase
VDVCFAKVGAFCARKSVGGSILDVEEKRGAVVNAFSGVSVLVTGGCGFIGSHLVERLVAQGAHVAVLDNLRAGYRANLSAVHQAIQIIEGDVRDAVAVERAVQQVRPQCVFHLAANASVPGSVQDPAYDFSTNCGGTVVLLDALRKSGGCERFVLASSGAVYGEPTQFPIREEHPLRPISPYGASKVAAEVETRIFGSVFKMPVVIARLFNTYGPRMARFVILDFMRKLQRDPSVLEVLGTGQQVRDFTYVSDTVEGLLTLAMRGAVGEAYQVSSGSACSVTDLAYAMLDALGLRGQTRIVYTGQSWVGDAQHWEVDIQKLRALGYQPQVPLAHGLELVIAWFKSVSANQS